MQVPHVLKLFSAAFSNRLPLRDLKQDIVMAHTCFLFLSVVMSAGEIGSRHAIGESRQTHLMHAHLGMAQIAVQHVLQRSGVI